MNVVEYYYKDFESYSEIFKEHALNIAELMKILNDEFNSRGLPPVEKTRELFRMTIDILYHVDNAYREQHNIDSGSLFSPNFVSKDDMLDSMRSLLKEELDRFLDIHNDK